MNEAAEVHGRRSRKRQPESESKSEPRYAGCWGKEQSYNKRKVRNNRLVSDVWAVNMSASELELADNPSQYLRIRAGLRAGPNQDCKRRLQEEVSDPDTA